MSLCSVPAIEDVQHLHSADRKPSHSCGEFPVISGISGISNSSCGLF